MRISDLSSDVCSSDLPPERPRIPPVPDRSAPCLPPSEHEPPMTHTDLPLSHSDNGGEGLACRDRSSRNHVSGSTHPAIGAARAQYRTTRLRRRRVLHRRDRHFGGGLLLRSEEHPSELQSLMRSSYA